MFLALAGCLGNPNDARAEDVGDWYFDPIEDADVILIGQAQEVHAGRVVNGCQLTAATVQVEDVILGRLPSANSGDLTVEFVGDCAKVGTLGGAVPKERAIWFLVNKGAWLREYVLAKTGDWVTEDAYWRPLEPDAIAVDHGGALETYGTGSNWLGSGTFDDFVAELRDSEYLRPNHDAHLSGEDPVGAWTVTRTDAVGGRPGRARSAARIMGS